MKRRKTTKKLRRKQSYKTTRPNNKKVSPHPIYIGPEDRITYVYELDQKGMYIRVDNVSYEIKIDESWYLVSRYDSIHGYLHCHITVSTKNKQEVLYEKPHIIKKGDPKRWLTWAIKDFQTNFFKYRTGFLKRSNIRNVY